MGETIVLISGIVVAVIFQFCYSRIIKRKQIIATVIGKFGVKPDKKEYDFEKIRILCDEYYGDRIEIDDITWNDLDMNYVYARINNTSSFLGEQYLYAKLRVLGNEEELKAFGKKVDDFERDSKKREAAQLALLKLGKANNSYYIAVLTKDTEAFALEHTWVYKVMSGLLVLSIAGAVLFHNRAALLCLGLVFLVNLCIYALKKSKYEINMDLMSTFGAVIDVGKQLSAAVEPCYERESREALVLPNRLNKIKKMLVFVSGRHQGKMTADFMGLCGMYITGAFLLDFVFYNRIIKEIEKQKEAIKDMIFAIGELDLAIATASFRKSLPCYCLPQFVNSRAIQYVKLYNPLLDNPITNDISLLSGCVITGSNASGKSTFIKAIAINEILAQSINTCAASAAKIPFAGVFTSMAIKDDVLAGESYFVKEVKSLGRIVDKVNKGHFIIAVIDEILRGTNTRERLAASSAVLQYLQNKNCIVIVATHDTEMLELLRNSTYEKYYFCEKADKDKITFDFKVREGISTQTNAIKLLEVMGFPGEIINKTKEIAFPNRIIYNGDKQK